MPCDCSASSWNALLFSWLARNFSSVRLTRLKLAGFKTFVDPTSIVTSAQLVGVVGPNGCGKSNVIDAVRWVLGESRAGALRGESMEDVIFNGSGTRKPVGRASVEMHFDNSLGRAAGQWSQYGEITVKRVLERSGTSIYYINNLKVRRRDVIDLFLGTGLGPRAYAIIEQGMISRIIEARPEDVRAFLEEAAGVTKYKERRRETEGRLGDARDNLARLEDIRGELAQQLGRLESQARVAEQYQGFQAELLRRQQLLWWIKRSDAAGERHRLGVELSAGEAGLESVVAQLRHVEASLEATRLEHHTAGDAVHHAQNRLFEVNAELARLEAEQRHLRESREKALARLGALGAERQRWAGQQAEADLAQVALGQQIEQVAIQACVLEERHEIAAAKVPDREADHEAARRAYDSIRQQVALTEQQVKVEEARLQAAERALAALAQRRDRLEASSGESDHDCVDVIELARVSESIALLEARLEAQADSAALLEEQAREFKSAQHEALQREKTAARSANETRAKFHALAQLQHKLGRGGPLEDWLHRHGLKGDDALWQHIRVSAGWELAVEAVLRERLRAVRWTAGDLPRDSARQTVALLLPVRVPDELREVHREGMELLSRMVECAGAWGDGLRHWLAGTYAVEDLDSAQGMREQLASGEVLVDRLGRVADRGGVVIHAPDAASHGLLERQRELELLEAQTDAQEARHREALLALQAAEEALENSRTAASGARTQAEGLQQELHRQRMAQLKLEQVLRRSEEHKARLTRDLAELAESQLKEEGLRDQAVAALEAGQARLEELLGSSDSELLLYQRTEMLLRDARNLAQQAERELREMRFSERELAQQLEVSRQTQALAMVQLERIAGETEVAQGELGALDEQTLQDRLLATLSSRGEKEERLLDCRNAYEEVSAKLRMLEEERLRTEQSLHPLRERLSQLRLAQQAAALSEAQFAARLEESGADEAALQAVAMAADGLKETLLQRDINRLTRQIEELGPVNLAALDELGRARERAGYLGAQSDDLNRAIATLEEAIRRIDRETRAQLSDTYEAVNTQFGTLFPELFGGGEARLVLTGDEILDSGIQIVARPPGKKNSSIHLLSGGEKALTAIALVFSLFQLNPAPFCMLDEVDAPLDDSNTERFCDMVRRMSAQTQFIFISHNKITMELAQQLVGVTMQEQGVSRVVEVDMEEALRLREDAAA